MAKITFAAPLKALGPKNAWVFLWFPNSASAKLGTRSRVPVTGTINGFPFRTSAFPSGTGTHVLSVNKAMQRGANAAAGDWVRIVVEVDSAPRVVEVPADLRRAIGASAKRFRIEALPRTNP